MGRRTMHRTARRAEADLLASEAITLLRLTIATLERLEEAEVHLDEPATGMPAVIEEDAGPMIWQLRRFIDLLAGVIRP